MDGLVRIRCEWDGDALDVNLRFNLPGGVVEMDIETYRALQVTPNANPWPMWDNDANADLASADFWQSFLDKDQAILIKKNDVVTYGLIVQDGCISITNLDMGAVSGTVELPITDLIRKEFQKAAQWIRDNPCSEDDM